MNVKINWTDERKTLSLIDRKTGSNWVADLIGNAGAFSDEQFVWSEEDNAYLADADTVEWWDTYITDYQKTEDEVHELADEVGIAPEDVWMEIANNLHADYEEHRRDATRTIKRIRADHYAKLIAGKVEGDEAYIADWLYEGDQDYSDINALAAEWKAYDE